MEKRYQNVSEKFKQECKADLGQYEKTGKLHVLEDNIDITESNNLVDFEIEDYCYVNDKFVGTTVAKKITVNILNPNNEINLENKEISVQTGMIIDGKEEIVPFGNFIIEKPDTEELKGKTSFTGYDYMIKFNTLYKNRVSYPIQAGKLFEDLCEQVGLEVGNTDFVNSNYMILGNPFTDNEDCRTVLSNIAQLAGGFAKIGRDNKVYIKSLKNISNLLKVKDVNAMTVKDLNLTIVKMLSGQKDNADESIDGNNYLEDFSKNEEWGELNSLILRISGTEGENTTIQDEDSITKNGLTELVIEDNYFLIDQTEREKAITPLWNSLKGIKYLPFDTEYYGYPYLDSGDIIYIQDTKDVGYVSYVFNHTFTFNGAYSGTLKTDAMTKTQTAYKNTINSKTKFRRVERKIDKINGVIQDIIEENTETSEKLTEVEQTIDGITQKVSSVEEKVETVENKADTAQSTANEIKSQTIYKVDVMYAISSSSTTAPTTGWQTTAPQWENGKYMWQKTVTTYGDGTQKETSATCITGAKGENGQDGTNGAKGDTGIGVEEIEEQYYLSNSNTTQTGGSWKTTQDTWSKGKYIWTRNKITWTDNTVTYTTPILATGLNNANSMADTANTTANTANTTANNAKDTADNALVEANSAKTQVTTITNKVTEVEQTVEGITQNVSEVEEKITSVETKADNANNKIDNLSVGARNLLLSTQTQNTEKGNTITGAVKTGEKFLNCDVFRSSNAWASIGFNLKRVIEDNNLKVGDKVTYSIYNKTDDTVARDIALYTSPLSADGTGSRELKLFKDTLNTEWTRLVVTFEITETMMNCKETNNLRTRYECKTACTTGKYQYWCAPKLELGTIATDWTPAPEDVEDNLTTNYYTKTETNSQIDQKANQITQTVSETYSTKTETTNAKQEAINSANASTDDKLEGYYTTSQTDSIIEQTANQITQEINSITGENSIKNGDFNNETNYWTAVLAEVTEYQGVKHIQLTSQSTSEVSYISQELPGLFSETDYILKFKAIDVGDFWTGTYSTFTIEILQNTNNSEEYSIVTTKNLELTETEEEYSIKFQLNKDLKNTVIRFKLTANYYLQAPSKVLITDVKLSGGSITERFASLKVGIDGINSEVSKKVGEDEVISKINQSAEQIQINANKISLKR